ncbi:hypothetical protein ABK040_016883 [Willaertia magna]
MKSICLIILLLTLFFFINNSNQQLRSYKLSNEVLTKCLNSIKQFDTCSFYKDCLEQIIPCGSKGYAIGYGYKYCSKFFEEYKRGDFDTEYAENWVHGTGLCLQQVLYDKFIKLGQGQTTCDDIIEYAFNSHPACYTNNSYKGNKYSICNIRNIFDIKTVVTTVSAKDLFSMRSFKQILGVAKNCVKDFTGLEDKDYYTY